MANRDSKNCNEPPEFPNKELQHGESNISPATCLSPPVYSLLCDSGISNTAYDVLTSDYTIDWYKMDQKLDLIDRNRNIDVADYYRDTIKYIAPCIESIKNAYQKLSPQEFSTSVCPHLLWTRNEKVFLRAFELLQENCSPSQAVLAGLLLTACIEKALGDFYLLKCPIVPYLVKDLIASPEMAEIFGHVAFKVLKIIMGPPESLNLRNVLWHGFVSSEMDARYGFFLLAIATGLGAKFDEQHVYRENVKYRNFVDFRPSEILCAVFPDIGNNEIVEVQDVFQSSHLILPIMKEHWQYCLKKYLDCSFGECIALLIPQLEHLLRVLFASVNNCPERVLTAEATCHFTTLSIILSEFLHDGKKNCLRACLGDNIMELLYDVLVLPEGPRIRDRVSHGEADFLQFPKFLTVLLISTAAVICLKVATKPTESSYLSKLAQIGDTYQTVFHPFAILKKKIFDLIESLKEWKSCPVVESEDLNLDYISDANFLVCDTVHVCVSLVGETFEISHIVFSRFYSYSEGLDDLTGALEKLNISSIYRPKSELQFCAKLRNIIHHSFKSSQNIQQALYEFSDAWKCQALRRRRMLTYIRLLKSLFTLYSGIYIVLIVVVGYSFLINKTSEWAKKESLLSQKFLNKMVTYTENLSNLTDSNKNMWVESSLKTKDFLSAVSDYCKNVNNIKTESLK